MSDLLNLHRCYAESLFALIFQAIRKVMKMDAAEPFNIPVDPVALGIPVSILCYTLWFLSLQIHHITASVKHDWPVQRGKTCLQRHLRALSSLACTSSTCEMECSVVSSSEKLWHNSFHKSEFSVAHLILLS
jgi:hypothetical protein